MPSSQVFYLAIKHATMDFLFAPSPAVAGCLLHGMVKALPGGGYVLPAGMHPLVLVILRGEIRVCRPGGTQPMARISLCGGTRESVRAWAAPGTRILTLAVKPGQLRRIVDFPALTIMDSWADFDDFLTGQERGEAARCQARLAETDDTAGQVQAVMALLSVLHQGRAGGKADIVLPPDGFSLPPAALAARFGLSLRQFERRFRASYGQSLRGLRQQLRCSQLMRFVAGRPSGAGTWADVAARFGYCDQSHLIHDVLRFTGYTPGQLAAGVASDDPAFWPYRVAPHHMTHLFGPSGY